MLVVLACNPITTPFESGFGEKFEAEIVVVYLVGEVQCALAICTSRSGLDEERAILTNLKVRIIERIDVNGQSAGMLRQVGATRNVTVAKARGVVVAHLRLIISIIDVGQEHPLDGVLGIEELAQDAGHAVGNLFVADHLTHVHLVIVIPVKGADMAQVVYGDKEWFYPINRRSCWSEAIGRSVRKWERIC